MLHWDRMFRSVGDGPLDIYILFERSDSPVVGIGVFGERQCWFEVLHQGTDETEEVS